MNKWLLIFLGVFLLLFGFFAVTNVQIEWGKPLMGFSALLAGIVCCIFAARSFSSGP